MRAIRRFMTFDRDNAMGEAGFNSAGVGMKRNGSIYNGRAALAATSLRDKKRESRRRH